MSATAAVTAPERAKKGGRKSLIFSVLGALVIGGAAAGWFSGYIPALIHAKAKPQLAAGEAHEGAVVNAPVFVDMPEMITNLNNGGRRAVYIKLKAKLEVARKEDALIVQNAMPRVIDLFQGYLREMRPEELRGSAGTYRLREELISRTNIAAVPAKVLDVLLIELLVQ
ncbi:MAG: flagellar basal body-associated FliL family protein [Acetobacteraceae bacterium]|nr:flagellar basal body-associated FliL family protein [Acetobacteraceae bacterium]